jgi:hypothetical protein
MTENNHLDVVARLAIHEAVCAERYREVRDSLEAIQRFLNRATWTIGSGMALIIGWLIIRFVVH